jgi:hypothetical protein
MWGWGGPSGWEGESWSARFHLLEATRAIRSAGHHARVTNDLARIWLQKGNADRAIQTLQQSLDFDRAADAEVDGPYGHDWMPNALLLVELCRAHGCAAQAAAIEADLEKLLVAADPDFPLLVKLRRLQR